MHAPALPDDFEPSFWLAEVGWREVDLCSFIARLGGELLAVELHWHSLVNLMEQPLANPRSDAPNPVPGEASARWFAEEVYPHGSALKAHLRSSFPAVRDFEDVVQESYVRVWRRQATRPIESVKGFLYQVARRLAIDSLRRDRRRAGVADENEVVSTVPDERPSPAAMVSTGEMHELLAEAFLTLPNRCREILVLRRIKGLSQREVADQLNLSERTVENQCRIGIEKCEKFLRGRGVSHLYHHGV